VVPAQPRVDRGGDEQWVGPVPLQEGSPLDPGDDGRVETEAGMEEEAPTFGDAEADALEPASVERLRESLGGLHGVVGDADAAREDVGRSARQRRQGGGASGQAVGGFAERPVTAEHDDHVDALEGGAPRDAGGVPAPRRFLDLELVIGTQDTLYEHAPPRRDRRRRLVHDQEKTHLVPSTASQAPALRRRPTKPPTPRPGTVPARTIRTWYEPRLDSPAHWPSSPKRSSSAARARASSNGVRRWLVRSVPRFETRRIGEATSAASAAPAPGSIATG